MNLLIGWGLDDSPEIDPLSTEESPHMKHMTNNQDEAATDMWYSDWLEIFRAYRERELNNGIERQH